MVIGQPNDSGTAGKPCEPNLRIENAAICNLRLEALRLRQASYHQQCELSWTKCGDSPPPGPQDQSAGYKIIEAQLLWARNPQGQVVSLET